MQSRRGRSFIKRLQQGNVQPHLYLCGTLDVNWHILFTQISQPIQIVLSLMFIKYKNNMGFMKQNWHSIPTRLCFCCGCLRWVLIAHPAGMWAILSLPSAQEGAMCIIDLNGWPGFINAQVLIYLHQLLGGPWCKPISIQHLMKSLTVRLAFKMLVIAPDMCINTLVITLAELMEWAA